MRGRALARARAVLAWLCDENGVMLRAMAVGGREGTAAAGRRARLRAPSLLRVRMVEREHLAAIRQCDIWRMTTGRRPRVGWWPGAVS